jgi:hypothetical protein
MSSFLDSIKDRYGSSLRDSMEIVLGTILG